MSALTFYIGKKEKMYDVSDFIVKAVFEYVVYRPTELNQIFLKGVIFIYRFLHITCNFTDKALTHIVQTIKVLCSDCGSYYGVHDIAITV